jgi:hypothetical protein
MSRLKAAQAGSSRIAYFDLASGASGDMIIAALVHAGRSAGVDVGSIISDAVDSLDLGCAITFVDDHRGGLACLRAEVKSDGTAYTPAQLRDSIDRAEVSDVVCARAMAGLDALVRAEAAVHGTDPQDLHLHELGTADTSADLIGTASAFEALDVSEVASAPVPVPSGWMSSAHGALPLPAPVTLELLKGTTVRGVDSEHELVTPTGIAVLLAHDASFGPLPEIGLEAVGVGGGSRSTDRPNISRVLVGRRAGPPHAQLETCVLLETNIDDQTPESLGHAIEAIIQEGALDAWVSPIVMKHSRPAFLLSVLARPEDESSVTESVFRHTTTLGIRRRTTTRWTLERSEVRVRVGEHDVRVKVATMGAEIVNVAPEFQDCVTVAERLGVPVDDVYEAATQAARSALD